MISILLSTYTVLPFYFLLEKLSPIIKVIYTLLQKKKTIGVVGKTCYFYRRNNSGQNLIATSQTKRSWYFEYFTCLNDWLANFYTEHEGHIPDYVQYLFASEIQWRFKADSNTIVERNILGEEEFEEYKKNIQKTLNYINDEYIMQIPSLYFEQKIHILKIKRGKEADIIWDYRAKKGIVRVNNTFIGYLSKLQLTIELAHIEGNSVVVEGYFTIPNIVKEYRLIASFNGESIEAEWLSEGKEVMFFKESFLTRRPYRFVFDMTDIKDVDRGGKGEFVNFYFCVDTDKAVCLENIKYGKRSPFTGKYKNSFYHKDGITVLDGQKRIYLARESDRKIKERNKLFRKELLSNKNDIVSIKGAAVRMGLPALMKQKKKPVWLISDRYEKAGDNGEAFFKFIVENHKEIDAYFVLFKSSDDYERISKIGNVIEPYSWEHKMKHLVADAIISAHADDFIYNPFRGSERPYKDFLANKKFIFLQHGIIKDDISRLFNRLDNNISMFVTSVVPEYKSLLEYPYLYTEKQVKLTGLPRYDLLENKAEKVITILPTWRSYVVTGTDSHTGKRNVKPGYEKTMYYKMYSELLSNKNFINEITKNGYKLQWVIHPNMTGFQKVFNIDERIEVMPENVSYREVFEKTSLMITDYSSVAFDVAYMRKPVVYYQADHEEFFGGLHTYDKGYFEYERDGLGEVEYTIDGLMKTILQYIEKDCELNPVYRKRIDNFFAFDDKNNCQRVYEQIINLEDNDG